MRCGEAANDRGEKCNLLESTVARVFVRFLGSAQCSDSKFSEIFGHFNLLPTLCRAPQIPEKNFQKNGEKLAVGKGLQGKLNRRRTDYAGAGVLPLGGGVAGGHAGDGGGHGFLPRVSWVSLRIVILPAACYHPLPAKKKNPTYALPFRRTVDTGARRTLIPQFTG